TGSTPKADGFTFVLTEDPQALGAGGDGLGYRGIQNSVAVKGVLYNATNGANENATGITFGGTVDDTSDQPIDPAATGIKLNDGKLYHFVIDYRPGDPN